MKILHLYPQLMNLYGEYGNVAVLKKHLEDQGEEAEVVRKEIAVIAAMIQVVSRSSYNQPAAETRIAEPFPKL